MQLRDWCQQTYSTCPYAGAGGDIGGQARPPFASMPGATVMIETLDPFRALLVRKAIYASDDEAVSAVWSGLDPRQQTALALLEQAIFLSRREYLEQLIPERTGPAS